MTGERTEFDFGILSFLISDILHFHSVLSHLVRSSVNNYFSYNIFIFRKFLAALVLALHVTPGRRLLATFQKYKRCCEFMNPPDALVEALIDLLEDKGWSNSVEDLGTALEVSKDYAEDFVKISVERLLRAIVDRLLQSKDYKVKDMARRHQISLEFKTTIEGNCPHNSSIVTQERAFALLIDGFQGNTLSFVDLQYELKRMKFTTEEVDCQKCGEAVVKIVQCSTQEFSDPDFLTIVLARPAHFLGQLKAGIKYGASRYSVKTVVHQNNPAKSASVSRQKEDGWWWHGVDTSQGLDFKYNAEQLQSNAHLRDVVVMMMVRINVRSEKQEIEQYQTHFNDDKQGKNEKEAVPYTDHDGNSVSMEDFLNVENIQGAVDDRGHGGKNGGNVEVLDTCDTLGSHHKEGLVSIGSNLIDNENQERGQSRKEGVRCEGQSDSDQSYFDTAEINSQRNYPKPKSQAESLAERRRSREPAVVSADIQFERDTAAAQAVSRNETPGCLTAEQVIRLGIRTAARLGILCRRPNLDLDGNSFIPMDGNCTFSCFTHANDPTLRGADFKQATWELRIRAVGSGIERLKHLNDEQWALLQAIVTKDGEDTLSKEEIKVEMEKYMESGQYSGNMGDILPQLAADFLEQPLLVIEIKNCKVTNVSLVKPGGLFGGQNQDPGCLVIVVKQMNHYEVLLVATEARETAKDKYQQWKESGRVGEIAAEEFNVGVYPPCNSTPRKGHEEARSKNEQNARNLLPSQSTVQSSLRVGTAHQCICNYEGSLADHLRVSKQCLQNLRKEPMLQNLVATDEIFIVKATVILKGCPARGCPGGSHREIPDSCLHWWREVGWDLMKFKGCSDYADSATVKQKASRFRTNFTQRNTKGDEGTSDEQQTCRYCQTGLPFVAHLREAASCLQHYRGKYLPYHGGLYGRIPRLAIFDLSLVQGFCPNPSCTTIWRDLAKHLRGPCLEFYQSEGAALFPGWGDSGGLYAKLVKRKNHIKNIRDACSRGPQNYTQELEEMLRNICCTCFLQGPFLNEKDHQMVCVGTSAVDGTPLWQCGECQHQQNIEPDATRIQRLGSPGEGHDDTLVPLKVEDECGGEGRVVFVPAVLAGDHPIQDVQHLPQSTTVLVPKIPDAVTCIGEEALRNCYDERTDLKKAIDFISKRPFQNSVQVTLSTLYRKKLADIQEERLTLMHSMSISKGEVTSRDPPQATVIEKRAHYDATKNLCFTKTCPWSLGHQQLMMDESSARSNVSGQMKTRVTLGLTTKVATDNQELREVIEITYRRHGVIPLLSIAPLVLKHVKAKVTLLERHIFSNQYNNWDLEVIFEKEEWTVNLSGFLYSEEFENINKRMARQGVSGKDIVSTILDHPHTCPTASLEPQNIADWCSISMERAQVTN